MPDASQAHSIDLKEMADRNRVAREIATGFLVTSPAEIWRYLEHALADTTALIHETTRLRRALALVRLDRANLAAAALATLAAYEEGEPDSLSYLRDELAGQGYDPGSRR